MPIFAWFDKVASVYVEADDFQAAVKTDLDCGLFHVDEKGAATGSDRAELMATRRLLWDPAFDMPEGSQVEIDGIRWQTPRGGFGLFKDNHRTRPSYRRCDVLRAV